MEKIALDMFTERLLLKRTRDLIRFVSYDIFVRIEQIVNEAINNHYFYRSKLEELLALLQEVETQKVCEENTVEQRASKFKNSCMTASIQKDNTVFYNQMYDYEVVRYKKIIIMMLAGQVNVDDKAKINGVTF